MGTAAGRQSSRSPLYIFLYAFHMPAFIIISGYFSRSFTAKPAQLKRLVTGIAVPYLVFETAYTFFKRWANDDGEADRQDLADYRVRRRPSHAAPR